METIRIFSKNKAQGEGSAPVAPQSTETIRQAVVELDGEHIGVGGEGDLDAPSSDAAPEQKGGGLLKKLDAVSQYLLVGLAFLMPVFFWPGFSVSFSKAMLFVLVTVILAILWIIRQLKSDRLAIPTHILPLSMVGVATIFLISALVSGHSYLSLFGAGFESGTAVSVIAGIVLALIVPSILRTKERVFAVFSAFFISFFVLALYQGLRLLVGPSFLGFGILSQATDNLIGKWNELGIFFGLTSLLSVVALESLFLNRTFKIIAWIALVISLLFVATINFSYTLIPIAIGALIGGLYLYAIRRRISVPIVIVFLVCALFLATGSKIHGWIYNHISTRFAISQIEVSPSFSHTAFLMKHVWAKDPIFGTGPQLFGQAWLQNTPSDVNQSQFWDNVFAYARGLVPTYVVTTGILGTLALLAFFIAFFYVGLKAVVMHTSDSFSRYLLTSSFLGALYVWVFQFFYVSSITMAALAFLFTGIFLALLYQQGIITEKKFMYRESPRASFAWVLLLITALVGTGAVAVIECNKVLSSAALSRAYTAFAASKVEEGEAALKSALAYETSDMLYRTMVDLQVSKIAALLSGINNSGGVDAQGNKLTREQVAAQLSPLLTDALDFAGKAITENPDNYENWIALGGVYEGVMPLGYGGAYDNAMSAYTKAISLAPYKPSLPLIMARLEASKPDKKDFTIARTWIGKALALKPNYSEALFLDSQLSISEGNLKNAIASVSQVAFLKPSDPTIFFQLGYLKYSDKDYKGAIEALSRAVALNKDYANARYFLGLSLSTVGRRAEALEQFKTIAESNPDNNDIKAIIANLTAGRDALQGAPTSSSTKTGTTAKPAAKKGLPVKEN